MQLLPHKMHELPLVWKTGIHPGSMLLAATALAWWRTPVWRMDPAHAEETNSAQTWLGRSRRHGLIQMSFSGDRDLNSGKARIAAVEEMYTSRKDKNESRITVSWSAQGGVVDGQSSPRLPVGRRGDAGFVARARPLTHVCGQETSHATLRSGSQALSRHQATDSPRTIVRTAGEC
jgi:hypothetical protein